jgi:hypothetical protein
MSALQLQFEDAKNAGRKVTVAVDAQTAVAPGDTPETAFIYSPDGTRTHVLGDYRHVHLRIQAAAAQSHETGASEQPNTPVS